MRGHWSLIGDNMATIRLKKGQKPQIVNIRGESVELTQEPLEISPKVAARFLGGKPYKINFNLSDKESLKDAAPAQLRQLSREFDTKPTVEDVIAKMFPSKKPETIKKVEKAITPIKKKSEIKPKEEKKVNSSVEKVEKPKETQIKKEA